MKIKEITQYMETLAPLIYQEDYDNSGLICGNPEESLTGILLCLDVTEEVVEEAIRLHCNLIISHHPIIFKGLKQISEKNFVGRIIIKAIRNQLALYAAHTNLDNMSLGVNDRICDRLGLQDRMVLLPKANTWKKMVTFVPIAQAGRVREAMFKAGAGKTENYQDCSFNVEGMGTFLGGPETHPFSGVPGKIQHEAEIRMEMVFPAHLQGDLIDTLIRVHPYEKVAFDIVPLDQPHPEIGSGMVGYLPEALEEKAFLRWLRERMNASCIRFSPLLGKKLKKVAVCGGSGSFLLPMAISCGADALVTADCKYHDFFNADNQIVIMDIGHYESEIFTVDLFYDLITKNFPNFAPLKTSIPTNPVNYLS
ncbi:MAG: Nif3-like dinuclear metal center hexameric protein [Chitinophagaceae bacterium]